MGRALMATAIVVLVTSAAAADTVTLGTELLIVGAHGSLSTTGSAAQRQRSISLMSITLPRFDPSWGALDGVRIGFMSAGESIQSNVYAQDDTWEQFIFSPLLPLPCPAFDPGLPPAAYGFCSKDVAGGFTVLAQGYLDLSDPPETRLVFDLAQSFALCGGDGDVLEREPNIEPGSPGTSQNLTIKIYDDVFCRDRRDSAPFPQHVFADLSGIPLAQFVGIDPLNLILGIYYRESLACDNDDSGDFCTGSGRYDLAGHVLVTYDYTGLPLDASDLPPVARAVPLTEEASVPEPGTMLLIPTGLVALYRQRRKRTSPLRNQSPRDLVGMAPPRQDLQRPSGG